MKRKLIAKIFYWLFLKENTPEMYDYIIPELGREPTETGKMFYKVYNYLSNNNS